MDESGRDSTGQDRPWMRWVVGLGMGAFVIVIGLYRRDYIGQDGENGWFEVMLIGAFAIVFVVTGIALYREQVARRRSNGPYEGRGPIS